MHRNKLSRLFAMALSILLVLSTAACSKDTNNIQDSNKLRSGNSESLTISDTDYSNRKNWLSFGGDNGKDIDIFVVYPTVTFSGAKKDMPYVRLDSSQMKKTAAKWLKKVQDIMPSCNVYTPFYRQLNGVVLAHLTSDDFESTTYATPRDDIFAAFEYFLTNVNKGKRPFILLGHSQGAALVSELATLFLGNEKYYQYNKNHIITYAVGYSITQVQIDRNPNLKFSQSKDDTGVIVSWNTTAASEIASGQYQSFGTWNKEALVTNPISWESNETLIHASENGASMVIEADGSTKMVKNYANAVVDMEHHVLVTTTVPEGDYKSTLPSIGKFHQHDLAFFKDSVQQNINERIIAFTEK